jgi:hypothetical protein
VGTGSFKLLPSFHGRGVGGDSGSTGEKDRCSSAGIVFPGGHEEYRLERRETDLSHPVTPVHSPGPTEHHQSDTCDPASARPDELSGADGWPPN